MPPPKTSAHFIEPMLLLRTEKLPDGDEWIHELKLDGYWGHATHGHREPDSRAASGTRNHLAQRQAAFGSCIARGSSEMPRLSYPALRLLLAQLKPELDHLAESMDHA